MTSPVLRRIMIYLLLAIVLWVLFVWFMQRQVLFPRRMIPPAVHAEPGPGVEVLWLDIGDPSKADPERVEAWLIPGRGTSARNPGPAVIYAHGNGELIDLWQHDMTGYTDLGVTVLLVEYRGYGRSGGSPSQKGITQDFIAFYDLLANRPEIDEARIVFHGRSVGGGAVASLASQRTPAAMILESTFTSVTEMAWGFFIPRWLVRDRFDTLGMIGDYAGPVLILHGEQDTIVPPHHAERLHEAAPDSTLIVYEATDHNTPPPHHQYWADIEIFLRNANILSD